MSARQFTNKNDMPAAKPAAEKPKAKRSKKKNDSEDE